VAVATNNLEAMLGARKPAARKEGKR